MEGHLPLASVYDFLSATALALAAVYVYLETAAGDPHHRHLRPPDRVLHAGRSRPPTAAREPRPASRRSSHLVRDAHAGGGARLRRVLRLGDLRRSLSPHVPGDQGEPPLVLFPAHAAARDARPDERERGERGTRASRGRDLMGVGWARLAGVDLVKDPRCGSPSAAWLRPRFRRPRVPPAGLAGTARRLRVARADSRRCFSPGSSRTSSSVPSTHSGDPDDRIRRPESRAGLRRAEPRDLASRNPRRARHERRGGRASDPGPARARGGSARRS